MNIQHKNLRLFYCGGDLHTSLRDQGSRTVFRGAGQPLAEWKRSTVDSLSLLSVNNAGSVVGVAQGSEREQFEYTAYGHCSSLSSGRSSLGFNGEYYDDFLQGYLLGNGYRLLSGMRFNSPDSFAPFRVLNAYGYCDGDPINYADPSGHLPTLFKGWFRPRGYNTSKELLRQMGSAISSLETLSSNINYHPRMGHPAASEYSYNNKFASSASKLFSLERKLENIYKSSPQGFERARKKIGYDALVSRANTVLGGILSKLDSTFSGAIAWHKEWSEVAQARSVVEQHNLPYVSKLSQLEASIDRLHGSYQGGKKDYWADAETLEKRATYNSKLDRQIAALEAEASEIRRSMKPLPNYPSRRRV
ncbi:RHS repeat-associated core domain-containing protein [Pseudomonas sp. NPDC089392]|uniref:RHS repeat-associated core domain-containing protein n=1 Tax=Pseudomonas sp. NPDC089392 TaxID=3364459 RepID=UPI0037F18D7E